MNYNNMKRLAVMAIICLLALTGQAAGKATRVVILAIDGMSTKGFKKARTPNLDALMADGTLSTTTRNVMPSVTMPNWTTHLTGSGPEQHGVVNNKWTKEAKPALPPMDKDKQGYYPSVFKVLKENVPGMRTAFYYNWPNLIYPFNQKYLDEVSFLENDAYLPNYEKALQFIVDNQHKPTLVFLYTAHVDHAGHNFGWMTPQYITALEEEDKAVGDFIAKLKADGLYDSTYFLLLTDHGGIGKKHGKVSKTEMIIPWGITGPGIKKGYKMKEFNNTINTAPVILRLFGVKQPDSWIGKVPAAIFNK